MSKKTAVLSLILCMTAMTVVNVATAPEVGMFLTKHVVSGGVAGGTFGMGLGLLFATQGFAVGVKSAFSLHPAMMVGMIALGAL